MIEMPVSFVTAVFVFGVVVGELVIIAAQKLGRRRAEHMRWRYVPLSRPAGAAGSQAWPTGLLTAPAGMKVSAAMASVPIPVSAGPTPPTVAPTGNPYPDGWHRGSCRGCGAGQLVNEDGDCVDCAERGPR